MLILTFITLVVGRQWVESLQKKNDAETINDQSKAPIPKPDIKPTIPIIITYEDGKKDTVIADPDQYSNFIKETFNFLKETRQQLQTQMRQSLHENIDDVFQRAVERVPLFADWYFGYWTTYALLKKAIESAVQHTFSIEAQSLSDAVSYDLRKYLQERYTTIILQPEINEPRLQKVYREQLKSIHLQWLNSLVKVSAKFQVFVEQQTTHIKQNTQVVSKPSLVLDWKSSFNKINIIDYHRSGIEVWKTAGLTAGGALAGKAIGSAAAKAAAAKAAETALLSKLASPFVAKAVAIGGMGAIGTIGGPLGTVAGFIGGIGIDYLLNEGIASLQRDEFIKDTKTALQSTQDAWEELMLESLNKTIQVWFDDSIQLLPKFETTQK